MSEIQELKDQIALLQQELKKITRKPKKEVDPSNLTVREAFTMSYARRFGHDYPQWGVKENACIKNLVGSVGVRKAVWLIDWYMVWTDPFIVQAGHPLGLLVSSVVKMEAQLRRGGRYFDEVAASRVMKRLELEDREMEMEITAHGERKSRQANGGKIGFGINGKLPKPHEDKLLVERSGPLTAEVRGSIGSGESYSKDPTRISSVSNTAGIELILTEEEDSDSVEGDREDLGF